MKNKHVLLDTSIIIDHIRQPKKDTTLLFTFAKENYSLFASIISHTELYAGTSVWNELQARAELEDMFQQITLIPLTVSLSKRAGELRAIYKMPIIDALIAATALETKLPLATLNTKDFHTVKGLTFINAA